MKVKFRKSRLINTAIGIAVLLAAAIFFLVKRYPDTGSVGAGYSPMFMVSDYERTAEEIPEYAGERITYTFTIPEAVRNYGTLYLTFYLKHTYSEVSVEGVDDGPWNIIEAEGFHIGRTPGNYWASAPILPEYAGKTMKVVLTPLYRNGAMTESFPGGEGIPAVHDKDPLFIITERFMSMYMRMHYDLPFIIASSAAFIAGLFLALLVLFLPFDKDNKQRIFYLGLMTAAAGLWKLAGIPVLTLIFTQNAALFYYAGICACFLIPVFAVQMLNLPHDVRAGNKYRILSWLTVAAAIICFILQIASLVELHDLLLPVTLVLIAALWGSVIRGRKEVRQDKKKRLWDSLPELMGIPAALAVTADAVIWLLTGSARYMLCFLAVMLAEVLLSGVLYFRAGVNRDRELGKMRSQALVGQIRPHFIYNTMSSIYYLAEEKPEAVMPAIDHFSEYLQANFMALADAEPIPFDKETEITKAYIAIEEILHEGRLEIEWDTAFTDFTIPALTLQPLVENAIKHGMKPTGERLTVTIRTLKQDDRILITVTDNGVGIEGEVPDTGSGNGALKNISDRLALSYDGELKVRKSEEGGTEAEIILFL